MARQLAQEQFDQVIYFSNLSIEKLAEKYRMTKDEIRAAADREFERQKKQKGCKPRLKSKGPSRPWKDEELRRLVAMVDLGMSAEDIAEALGRSVCGVKNAIAYRVYRDRYVPLSDQKKQIIKNLYFELGDNVKTISTKARVSYSQTLRYIQKIRVEMEERRYGT